MDALLNLPEFVWEFLSRQDFIGVYSMMVGALFLWFAFRGLIQGEARALGGRPASVSGGDATRTGVYWLALAGGSLALGWLLWSGA